MAGYIPTRLIPILGVATLEEIEEEHLSRLLGVLETADLDFKEKTYGNNAEQARELAYDIAAMANDVGGLLIIGIAESDGRGTSLEGVAPDPFQEEEQLRIHKIVGARLFPPHRIEVQPVVSTSNRGRVFYVISVPPSEWAPHAVAADFPSLRWPRRSGPGRRWMSESEIADAYRRRHGAEDDQIDRAHEIHSAMVKELPNAGEGWLVMTLVPNRAGHMTISRASVREYQDWLNRGDDGFLPGHGRSWPRRHTRADFRSIRFADGHRPQDPAYSLQGRMYEDGSSVIAARYQVDDRFEYLEIVDEMLLGDVVNGLLLLGQHAVERSFTGGDAVVLAEFWAALGMPMLLTGQGRDGVIDQLDDSVRVDVATERSQHMVSLEDVASPGPGLLVAARMILCDLMSPFGVPEPRQLSEEGAINLRLVTQTFKQPMKDWAHTHGALYSS